MSVSQTSLESYDALDLGHMQALVLECVRWAGPLSNREIALALEKPINSITGRTLELRGKGLVKEAGRKKNPNGRNEMTWEIV